MKSPHDGSVDAKSVSNACFDIDSPPVGSLFSENDCPSIVDSSTLLFSSPVISSELNDSSDIDKLFSLRTEYHNHPLVGFLNINSIRNKIIDLRMLMERCLPDVLVIEETKINSDFKKDIFLVNNYQKPMSRDRNEYGRGIMLYARKGVVCNRVPALETPSLELLCSELIVNKKKWIVYCIYRAPDCGNIDSSFSDLSTTLNPALDRYDNIIVMGDINIDSLNRQDAGHSKLVSFCDVFGLSNLVTAKTCFTKNSSSSIDAILTNRPRCFQKTSVFETGLSDYHGLVMTVMKFHLPRLKPKVIKYRSYKNCMIQL